MTKQGVRHEHTCQCGQKFSIILVAQQKQTFLPGRPGLIILEDEPEEELIIVPDEGKK